MVRFARITPSHSLRDVQYRIKNKELIYLRL
jgi:hypothetical protein